jgi:DNA-binding FadR family transcriptional regulator
MMIKSKQPSAVSTTFDALLSIIESKEPGTILPAQELLSKQFGISRTVLREAMSMLITRNIVTVRSKIGTRVNPKSEWLHLIPQSMNTEIQETLIMFMATFRVLGYEGYYAYTRSQALLTTLPPKDSQ